MNKINKEIRATATMGINAEDKEKMVIEGKAVSFNSPTALYTDEFGNDYYEVIDPNAFENCICKDCCLRYNHKDNAPVLARTRGGSLTLDFRPDGVYFRAELFDTSFAKDCYELVKADALQCSFAFTIAENGDEYNETTRTRRIKKISHLWDLSIVDVPAYRDTFVKQARSYCEPHIENFRKEDAKIELKKLLSRMKTETIQDNSCSESLETKIIELLDKHKDDGLELARQLDNIPCFDRLNHINYLTRNCDNQVSLLREARWIECALKKGAVARQEIRNKILNGEIKTIEIRKPKEERKMEKQEIELRAFHKFVSEGSYKNLTTEERSALVTTNSSAVMPTQIFDKIIKEEKYSDLLNKATVMNINGAQTVKIPVASSNETTWKTEGEELTPKNPVLTSIELFGMELMRLIQYSASVGAMTTGTFVDWLAELCSTEFTEALEKAFVQGKKGTEPHDGLQNLTWNSTNSVTASTNITASDVAKGLSLLPQKYSRNAILLMNANTAYNTIGLFKGTSEYAYSLADGASKFMNKEIQISEYCADNEIYIVDPKELYVRFASPMQIDVNDSVGFTSALKTMRVLAIVDYAWNTKACVKVSLEA